jgi:hypothetical protein
MERNPADPKDADKYRELFEQAESENIDLDNEIERLQGKLEEYKTALNLACQHINLEELKMWPPGTLDVPLSEKTKAEYWIMKANNET